MKWFKDLIEFDGLSYKKEIILILFINIAFIGVSAAIYLLIKLPLYVLLIIMILWVVSDYIIVSRYFSLKRKIIKDRENEFVNILSYFNIYIHNNYTVYNSFKLIQSFVSNWSNNNISKLLTEIDKDKSVQPFINFAQSYNSITIESAMISIYQMVDLGNNDNSIKEFSILFKEIHSSYQKNLIDSKEKSFDLINALPLFGAGFITIILTFGIISIIGEMINVI